MDLRKALKSAGIIPILVMAGMLALVVTSQASAHTEIPQAGILHTCVNSKSGEIKLVGPNESCKKNQDEVDWNIIGPEGPVGPSGTSLWVDGSGKVTTPVAVGIGTTNPTSKLDVAGGKDTRITIDDSTQAWSWAAGWKTDITGDFSLIQEGIAGDRIYVRQNGNVGIGTTTPGNKLDVAGVIRGQSLAVSGDVLIVGNDSKIVDVDVLHTMGIYSNTDSTQGHIQLGSSGPKLSGINGNFGIGRPDPTSKLYVAGGKDTRITIDDSTQAWSWAAGWKTGVSGDFSLIEEGVAGDRIYVQKTTGNVGIGTTTPNARLDVNGDIRLGNGGNLLAVGGEENLRVLRGMVGEFGTKALGSGFTSAKIGGSRYRVTFNTAFPGPAIPVVTTLNTSGRAHMANIVLFSATSFDVVVADRNGTPRSASFTFIVVGPR